MTNTSSNKYFTENASAAIYMYLAELLLSSKKFNDKQNLPSK